MPVEFQVIPSVTRVRLRWSSSQTPHVVIGVLNYISLFVSSASRDCTAPVGVTVLCNKPHRLSKHNNQHRINLKKSGILKNWNLTFRFITFQVLLKISLRRKKSDTLPDCPVTGR